MSLDNNEDTNIFILQGKSSSTDVVQVDIRFSSTFSRMYLSKSYHTGDSVVTAHCGSLMIPRSWGLCLLPLLELGSEVGQPLSPSVNTEHSYQQITFSEIPALIECHRNAVAGGALSRILLAFPRFPTWIGEKTHPLRHKKGTKSSEKGRREKRIEEDRKK